jgi:hypothetical protein
MSHHTRQPSPGGVEHTVIRGAEATAALYALDHATRGTPIGAEGDFAAQAARTGGNFVIAAVLWHLVIAPYLVVTAVLFAIPTIAVAAIGSGGHWTAAAWLIVAGMALLTVWLWFRYATAGGFGDGSFDPSTRS